MLKQAITVIIFAFSYFVALAQPATAQQVASGTVVLPDSSANPQAGSRVGKVTVVADSSIINLERNTRGFRETKGYRIQIFLGTFDNVKEERNRYLALGLPFSAYLKQVVPEYALHVGDFTSRMEMEKNLEILKRHYPKAFAVVDVIEPPKFRK